MNFGFNAPVVNAINPPAGYGQSAPAAVAPNPFGQAGTAGMPGMPSALAALDTAEVFDSGKPKLPRGQYIVEFTKALIKPTRDYGDALIVEYKVETSNNGVSPGTEGSYFRAMKISDMGYLAKWLFQILGAADQASQAQIKTLLKFIVMAACTGQAVTAPDGTQIAPSVLIGRRAKLDVVEGTKPSKKSGKIYDNEYWSVAA